MESKRSINGLLLDEEDDIKPFSISEVGEIKLNYITGVLNQEDELRFKRLIFRVSKGYAWSMFAVMEEEQYGEDHKVILNFKKNIINKFVIDKFNLINYYYYIIIEILKYLKVNGYIILYRKKDRRRVFSL